MNSFQSNLTSEIERFISERNWSQFHTGKDIAMCLSIEANEVLELFLWKDSNRVDIEKLRLEIGDVFYALLLLSKQYGIDLEKALIDKMQLNKLKYPAIDFFGSNKKYSEE